MDEKTDYKEDAERLEKTLADFGVQGEVVNVVDGPVIAKFEVDVATGTKISKIENIAPNIALAMKVEQVRVAPVSDKGLVGIEVPKRSKKIIYLKEIIENEAFQTAKSLLSMAIGKDIGGTTIVADLQMPHMLIAGQQVRQERLRAQHNNEYRVQGHARRSKSSCLLIRNASNLYSTRNCRI